MKIAIWSLLLSTCLLVVCLVLTPAVQAAPKTAAKGQVYLDFKDIPIPDLIRTISELTGKNFLYDERVKGTATIISPDPMTLDEAYQLFLAALNVKGYAVVVSGKIHKIVPNKQARENTVAGLTYSGKSGDQYVTRLISLKYMDAVDLSQSVLKELVPKSTRVVPYPQLNRLIISDRASNIAQVARLVRELDVPGNEQTTDLIALEHASAESVSSILKEMLGTTTISRPTGSGTRTAVTGQPATILAYARTNTLVVKGSLQQVETVRTIARKLDAEALNDRAPVNVHYLEHADAETLAKTLNEIVTGLSKNEGPNGRNNVRSSNMGEVTITADNPTNSLIISAAPDDLNTLKAIIRKLDVKRKQVFVEALILDLSMDATEQLGVSLQGGIDAGNDNVISLSANQNTGNTKLSDWAPSSTDSTIPTALTQAVSGILAGGFFNPISTIGPDGQKITVPALSVLIDISEKDSSVNILSAPRLLTSDNEEAEIVVGAEVPIITSRLTDTGGSGNLAQSVTVERKDVALTLRLTPQITEGDQVRLNVYQEITDLANTAVGDIDEVGPTLTKRLVRNTVVAEDGRTVVLGGLISSNIQESISKVPVLGDVPILGWLFRNEGLEEEKRNLLIFITPTIIRDAGELAKISDRARSSMETFRRDGVFETFSEPAVNDDLNRLFTLEEEME